MAGPPEIQENEFPLAARLPLRRLFRRKRFPKYPRFGDFFQLQGVRMGGMQVRRPPNSVLIALLALLIVLPFVIYVREYFARSYPVSDEVYGRWYRVFQSHWQAEFFRPAARVESLITGTEVMVEP